MGLILESYTYLQLVLVAVETAAFCAFLYYAVRFLKAVGHRHLKKLGEGGLPEARSVSVVVVVQDDLDYIENVLPLLLQQKYDAPYQVVVVNDTPELEETGDLLKMLSERFPHLYVTTIRDNHHFKHTRKLAYTIGIKAARYDCVLFTTTRDIPANEKWLGLMSKGFVSDRSLVLGYSRIERVSGIMNRLERAVNIFTSLPMLAAAVSGKPFSGRPGNMGFTRRLFFDSRGYCRYLRLNSGENDLYLQRVRHAADTSVILSPSAVTERRSAGRFSVWYNRRKFDTYTYRYYPVPLRLFLGMENIFRILFWSASVALIAMRISFLWEISAALIGLRLLMMAAIFRKLSKRTQEKIPYLTCFLWDIVAPADALILSISRRLKPSIDLWI